MRSACKESSINMLALKNKKCAKFIKHVEEAAALVDVKILLKKPVKIKDLNWYGTFDETAREIMVYTMKGYDWVGVLAHEYSHMRQWLEHAKCWLDFHDCGTVALLDKILTGKTNVKMKFSGYSTQQLNDFVDTWAKMERDCEVRALKEMKNFELPIDTEAYAKVVNLFLFKCAYFKKTHIWPSFYHNQPKPLYYKSKKALALCPSKLVRFPCEIPLELERSFNAITSTK